MLYFWKYNFTTKADEAPSKIFTLFKFCCKFSTWMLFYNFSSLLHNSTILYDKWSSK